MEAACPQLSSKVLQFQKTDPDINRYIALKVSSLSFYLYSLGKVRLDGLLDVAVI